MLPELNYSAGNLSRSAIRNQRFALRGGLHGKGMCQPRRRLQQIFGHYLDYLEHRLREDTDFTDIGQIQEMLLELSDCIRSNNNRMSAEEYGALLERLRSIYAEGMAQSRKVIYAATAADYADLIEAANSPFLRDNSSRSIIATSDVAVAGGQ